ncbi:YwgA family protein [Desulfitobacterium sp. PCE1]|uniref:YwgA family protein n=1 Tax=Desulfitobacterium sp. PCE1 TaxID=146907 RepID=UPI00036A5FCF|nr:hypothetical protein [Desulfitobacterium sp. PCE1]
MFLGANYLLEIFSKGEIRGRKKLQKIVYLLEHDGMDAPYRYSYHHYGPYSAQLQEEIEFLVQHNFIEEASRNGTYEYRITDEGERFRKQIGQKNVSVNNDLLIKLNAESSQFLEMLSTYIFLLDSGYGQNAARIKAAELKPHLKDLIPKVCEYYNNHLN